MRNVKARLLRHGSSRNRHFISRWKVGYLASVDQVAARACWASTGRAGSISGREPRFGLGICCCLYNGYGVDQRAIEDLLGVLSVDPGDETALTRRALANAAQRGVSGSFRSP